MNDTKGLIRQSAIDFAIATLIERVKNLPPSSPEKIDEVSHNPEL
jgi:hypothetical protein